MVIPMVYAVALEREREREREKGEATYILGCGSFPVIVLDSFKSSQAWRVPRVAPFLCPLITLFCFRLVLRL
jgi:hypothetical protein